MSRRGPVRRWQRRWKDGWVGDLDAPGARRNAAIDMLVFDHGLLRKAWRNEHEIDAGVWRSNQPDPATIRRLAAQGIQGDPEPARRDRVGVVPAGAGGVPGGGDRAGRLQAQLAEAAEPGGDPGARRDLRAAAAAVPDALQVGRGPGGVRGGALPDAAEGRVAGARRRSSCRGGTCTCGGRRPGCCISCSSATRRTARRRR